MKIYDITLSVKNSEVPFLIEKSFGHSSGDLTKVIHLFLLDLFKFLEEVYKEELKEQLELHGVNDDIPF